MRALSSSCHTYTTYWGLARPKQQPSSGLLLATARHVDKLAYKDEGQNWQHCSNHGPQSAYKGALQIKHNPSEALSCRRKGGADEVWGYKRRVRMLETHGDA